MAPVGWGARLEAAEGGAGDEARGVAVEGDQPHVHRRARHLPRGWGTEAGFYLSTPLECWADTHLPRPGGAKGAFRGRGEEGPKVPTPSRILPQKGGLEPSKQDEPKFLWT